MIDEILRKFSDENLTKNDPPLSFAGWFVRLAGESIELMHYMLLIYGNKEAWEGLSKAERNQIHDDCGAWHQELVQGGHARTAAALHPASTATTVRKENGKAIVTDGPFVETKEMLGGFEIIDCKDLDEALAIAKRFPALRAGSVMEVRPVMSEPCRD